MPSEEEYEHVWSEGLIVLDASVLLSLYRYSTKTRDELIRLLGSLQQRLWLPHQAATEYERNRLTVIGQQLSAYGRTLGAFEKSLGTIRSEFSQLARHPLLDQDHLARLTDEYEQQVRQAIEQTQQLHPSFGETQQELMSDPTRSALEKILAGRVGVPQQPNELQTALSEARRRLGAKEPPGYLDVDKPEPDCYGDYLFWRQAIDQAMALKLPLILLTDDEKDDWWWRSNGKTLGPRPELVQEFSEASGGLRLLMYTTMRFIDEANNRLPSDRPVSAEAVDEVGRIAAERGMAYEPRIAPCPFCASDVSFRIGVGRNHTAQPRCEDCGSRFHAFHLADGSIGTRKPGESAHNRVLVHCPSCSVGFQTRLPDRGDLLTRACLRCGALMTIDDDGGLSEHGLAPVFTVDTGDDRCPNCGAGLRFIYTRDGEERTSCSECASLVTRALGSG